MEKSYCGSVDVEVGFQWEPFVRQRKRRKEEDWWWARDIIFRQTFAPLRHGSGLSNWKGLISQWWCHIDGGGWVIIDCPCQSLPGIDITGLRAISGSSCSSVDNTGWFLSTQLFLVLETYPLSRVLLFQKQWVTTVGSPPEQITSVSSADWARPILSSPGDCLYLPSKYKTVFISLKIPDNSLTPPGPLESTFGDGLPFWEQIKLDSL